jgi:hypothetical protein
MSEAEEEEQLAAYQEALTQLAAQQLAPEELADRLRNDERVVPFREYVNTFDLRCVEVASVLMRRWAKRLATGTEPSPIGMQQT